MKGKVMTVQGLIDPDGLGITLVHEHLVLDAGFWWKEPAEASKLECRGIPGGRVGVTSRR